MNSARLVFAAALLAALAAVSASAQQPRPPATRAEISLSFAPVVKKAAPAVVNIYAKQPMQRQHPLFDDPMFRRFFGVPDGPAPSLPRERAQRSLGSGVIVDPTGIVVTNVHVIEGAEEIRIALADRREFDAEVLLRDPRSDLAILRLKAGRERFPAIELGDSDELQVGDLVLAIGNPFGVGQTVTQGIVSALARTGLGISDYSFFIQTDAAINVGNSGGALVDMAGRLVGINTAIFSRSGGSVGIGFTIPVNMVRVVIESARDGGKTVRRPWFGATLQPVTPEIAKSMGLKRPAGALIANVTPASPAFRAGLKPGDLITGIDGQPVDDPNAFDYRFATKRLAGKASVAFERDGKAYTATIALEAAPERTRDDVTIRARSPFLGATVANLSPALAEELRLNATAEGVVIVSIEAGTTAAQLGFRPGDMIVEVNGERIAKSSDLERITRDPARQWSIRLMRGGQQLNVVFRG
jgi:Do/DeqQ family serine protease